PAVVKLPEDVTPIPMTMSSVLTAVGGGADGACPPSTPRGSTLVLKTALPGPTRVSVANDWLIVPRLAAEVRPEGIRLHLHPSPTPGSWTEPARSGADV